MRLRAVRLDGEDAHLEDVAPGVFQQRRVFELAHDVLVNPPRLLGGQQLGFDLLAVDLHRELVDVRAFGDGEDERAFQPRRVRVVELLVHRGHRYLVGDAGIDLDVVHVQRGEDVWAWAAGRAVEEWAWRDRPWPRWPSSMMIKPAANAGVTVQTNPSKAANSVHRFILG